jgi:hypothetical protein
MWFSSSPEKKVALHGLYASVEHQPDTKISQSFLLIMNVQSKHFQVEHGLGGILGFSIAPFSTQASNFRILGPEPPEEKCESSKFKLTTVQAC